MAITTFDIISALWLIATRFIVPHLSAPMHLPTHHLRENRPVTDGQVNDIYADMEKKTYPYAPEDHKISYGILGVYNSYTKDPEQADEGYEVLPKIEGAVQEAEERRRIEDLLIGLGFPLEELTGYDGNTGDVYKLKISEDDSGKAAPTNPWGGSGNNGPKLKYEKVYTRDAADTKKSETYSNKKKNAWG